MTDPSTCLDCPDCGATSTGSVGGTEVENLPGQRSLRWRASPHGRSLARMRDRLADVAHDLDIRSLAHQGDDEPAIALLDAWAVVADVVTFYTERIAQEGFLRTATERDSVRQHARSLGYELRPGVAAQVELAFEVETAPGAPAVVDVPAGTPVQTVPAPGQLPQTFETTAGLEARGVWNTLAAVDRTEQPLGFGVDTVWLETTTSRVRVDDHVLVVGAERATVDARAAHDPDHEKWDFRRVVAVELEPIDAPGWTRLTLDRPIGYQRDRHLVAEKDVHVYRLTRRLNLFGWNAPDPTLLGQDSWEGYAIAADARELEVDGDVADVVPGSWVVLEQPGKTEAYRVVQAAPDGATKFGLSGKLTRLLVDLSEHLDDFERNQVLVHAVGEELPAARMPLPDAVGAGHVLRLRRTEPPPPAGRVVVVSGREAGTRLPLVEATTVVTCTEVDDVTMEVRVEPPLAGSYDAGSVRVHANVAVATHGETVEQVLGSGDGRTAFPAFALRRSPLTYVRTTTNAAGAAAELDVRVDGVLWSEVPSLEQASTADRVYVVRQADAGDTSVVFGDGLHGARLPTGAENLTSAYRVGIGADGAADADQVRLLVRRPRGIADVTNPAPSRDWAAEENLEDARTNAPQRVRTLDRAVSVPDYEDFVRGYAGVGRARADLVWDGHVDTVVVSVLAAGDEPPSEPLLRDLRTTLDLARESRAPRLVLAAERLRFGAALRIEVDPRHERPLVEAAVRHALLESFGALDLGAPVPASGLLVVVTEVPGVVAVTMPRLSSPDLPEAREDLLVALPARAGVSSDDPRVLPAQALWLDGELLDVEVET